MAVVAVLTSLVSGTAHADDCENGENTGNLELAQALIAANSDNSQLIKQASEYINEDSSDLCMRYFFGRYLTRLERFAQSRTVLTGLQTDLAASGSTNVSPENVIGFGFLSEGNNDSALEAFQYAEQVPYFELYPDNLKTKILNNLGYTLMQVGIYDQASEALKRAAELGSSRAYQNLAAVTSIVSTLEESDSSKPGAFAAIVGSAKSLERADLGMGQITKKLDVNRNELSIFRMKNNRLSISIGRFKSYPAAVLDRDKAIEAGIPDAYVAWLADWELVETRPSE